MKNKLKDRKLNKLYLPKAEINKKAQLAYETYATNALKNAARGNVMPIWEELSFDQREAWRKVVLSLHGNNQQKFLTLKEF